MRIRKRKVPLPFSSLSPIPLSDPCFALFMPPVQHLLANSSPSTAESPPPDQAIDLDNPAAAPISPALNLKQAAGDIDREKIIITDEEGRNDFREKGIVGAHVVALSHSHLHTTASSSSFLDHEKAFPVKKRSSPWGSSEIVEQEDDKDQKEGSSNNIVITSTGTTANSSAGTASLIVLKKRGRGGALMEGSRCSRVNGRGWRCCQPTLVGYSLCEHHLGKGRLRSITSTTTTTTVRVGATHKNKEKQQRPASVVLLETTAANGSSDQEEGFIITKPVPMIRRRSSSSSSSATKLGMVKARSISSLLDETTTTDQTTTNETISRSRPSVFIGRRQ